MREIRIATRGSKLALVQAETVGRLLGGVLSDVKISLVPVTTKGDVDKRDFLGKSDYVGFFTSEVEKAVLNGEADAAVHSMKDLPTAKTEGIVLAAVPAREMAMDVLVAGSGVGSIDELVAGSRVGTSSARRIGQMLRVRSDIEATALRGNIETRLRKVQEGSVDAIIVAYAGLKRLGLSERISAILGVEDFVPAAGQGALAVQVRSGDMELLEVISQIDDADSRITAESERLVLEGVGGGCSVPLGVNAEINQEELTIQAMLCNMKGNKWVRRSQKGVKGDYAMCAEGLAKELLTGGGEEILKEVREA